MGEGEVRVARLDQVGSELATDGESRVAALGELDAVAPAEGRLASFAAFEPVAPEVARVAELADTGRSPEASRTVTVAELTGRRARRERSTGRVGDAHAGDAHAGDPAERPARRARGRGPAGAADPASTPPNAEVAEVVDNGPRRRRGSRAELDPDADPVAVAREICLRLLTDRARTRQELATALHRKGVPDEAAETVLSRFDEVGLIDDAAFAGQWVRSRHQFRGLARRAIAMELRRKGVADDVAGEALAEVDAESEEQRARGLVAKRLRTMSVATPEERASAARRLVGMLARKGYGAGIAYPVVKAAMAEHGSELDDVSDIEDAPME